jgi:hypothetical protein
MLDTSIFWARNRRDCSASYNQRAAGGRRRSAKSAIAEFVAKEAPRG